MSTYAARTTLGLILALLTYTASGQGLPLWSQAAGTDYQLNRARLIELMAGDAINIPIADDITLELSVTNHSVFTNGDRSLSAKDAGGESRLVLTYSGKALRGTVFSPLGQYRITGSGAVLRLTKQSDKAVRMPADPGGVLQKPSRMAPKLVLPPGSNLGVSAEGLSGNDVTIEQQPSKNYVVIGDSLTMTVTITNNLNTSISNQDITIFFIRDGAEFLGSSEPSCQAQITAGGQNVIQCRLASLDAGALFQFDYSVQTSAASYPFLASGVFVGQPFGSNVRDDEFVFIVQDVTTDSDGDGDSDFNEALVGSNPASAGSSIPDDYRSTVDLMFLYSADMLDDIGGSNPELEINQMVAVTNDIYADSDIPVVFRPVYYGATDYVMGDELNQAFDDLKQGAGPHFSAVSAIRDRLGADVVVLLGGYLRSAGFCGLGTLSGSQASGDMLNPNLGGGELFVAQYLNGSAPDQNRQCGDDTLAHELGHNFGLIHSRQFTASQGTFPWSSGYGVPGSFTTIMAYPSNFSGARPLPLFSNPARSDCLGQSCGRQQSDGSFGADAVSSLKLTHYQIAAINESSLLAVATLDGSQSSAIFYGGASVSSEPNSFRNTFSASDSLSLSVTLQVPRELQGLSGRGHLLFAVAGAGFLQQNSNGDLIPWDGSAETLVGATELAPLPESLTLTAFDGLVPAAVNVNSAQFTAYFAFEVPEEGPGGFVYTSAGVPIIITPQ
jgi:hypothetical protein